MLRLIYKYESEENMKKIIIGIVVVGLLLSGFTGCDLFNNLFGGGKTSITERISQFQDALNSADRSGINSHFHADTANRQTIADSEVLATGPLSYDNASFTLTPGTPGAANSIGQVTVSVNITNANVSASDPIIGTFIMQEDTLDSGNWLIRELSMSYGGTTYTIKKIGF